MKKVALAAAALLLVVGISAGTAMLLLNREAVPVSTTVKNGLSAYELAVQYGYEGTVEEWLDSLEGKSAYEIAVDNGYSGTEEEWGKSLEASLDNPAGIKNAEFNSEGELVLTLSDDTELNLGVATGKAGTPGKDGIDGKDGIPGQDGVDGRDGSNGKDGINGEDGADGKDGVNGKDGVSVSSASINNEGQLVIGFSDGKLVNLDKVVGMNGKDGVSVVNSQINEQGELVITYSNGQEAVLGTVVGADGKDGVDGKDGIDAITSAGINASGELVLTYSDGTSSNLGAVVGADGEDGKDGIGIINAEITSGGELVLTYSNNQRSNLGSVIGRDGQNGQDGKDGQDGQDGVSVSKSEINSNGELVVTYSDGKVENLGKIVGSDGKDGVDGTDGQDGKDGEDGADGQDGTDGKDGVGIKTIEISEADELLITLTNDTALNLGCIRGKDGAPGTDGKDGVDGISVTGAQINENGELVLAFSDNTQKNLGVVVGADGLNGADGQNGTDGQDGQDGIGIKATEINELGELVITYTDETVVNLGVIIQDGSGTQADAPRVRINEETNEWEISNDGGRSWISTGVEATGENGVGVSGAKIDEADHLIIILSDGSTIDVGVVVGADGKDGTDGKDGEDGKDGTGIKDVTVTAEGILTVILDNDTVITLGNIKGQDGVGIAKSEINEEGKLVITYTDGKVVTLNKVVGDDGLGIKKIELTADYMLKLTLDDDSVQTLGPIRGEKGEKGDPGEDGKTPYIKNGTWWIGDVDTGIQAEGTDGSDGADGQDGTGVVNSYVDENLHLWIELSDGTRIDAGYVGVASDPEPTVFTVVFRNYDNSILKTEEVEYGKPATAPEVPQRDGYIFAGWDKDFSSVTENMVVTANFTEVTAPSFIVDNVSAKAGDEVWVDINVKNNPGILGMTLMVEYDESVMTLESSENGDALSMLTMTPPGRYYTGCRHVWYGTSLNDSQIKDGAVLRLKFKISDTAQGGNYPVRVSYVDGDIIDKDLNLISLDTINGSVAVSN